MSQHMYRLLVSLMPKSSGPPPSISVSATTTSATNTASTSHVVSLPSGSNGKLFIFIEIADPSTTMTTPSGWNLVATQNNPSGDRSYIFGRDADGSEGSTVTVTSSASFKSCHIAARVSDARVGFTSSEVTTATPTTGASNANPDPGSVTTGWGTEQFLSFASCGVQTEGTAINAYPTTHPDNRITSATSTGTSARNAIATRVLTGTSDNPGTFTTSIAVNWVAFTVAVRQAL